MSEIPEFESIESEEYKIVYATGAFGTLTPKDGEIILFVDRVKPTPIRGKPGQERIGKIIRERQVEIHISPVTWKSLARWMQGHVERFEKQFGTILEKPKGATEEHTTGLSV